MRTAHVVIYLANTGPNLLFQALYKRSKRPAFDPLEEVARLKQKAREQPRNDEISKFKDDAIARVKRGGLSSPTNVRNDIRYTTAVGGGRPIITMDLPMSGRISFL